jgi:cytochrome c oxidase subunit 3
MATHPQTHPVPHVSRLALNRLGLWFFFLSEAFLFAVLLSSRFYLLRTERPDEVNQPLGLAITFVLLLSSLTAYRAEMCARHGDLGGLLRNLAGTIALGLLFLVGVGVEWWEAFHYFPPHTLYGTVFFTTTGIHAFHVFTGILALAVVLFLARDGRFTGGHFWGVEGVVKYWHFVDVAWVFIYPTLYLVE